MVQPFITFIKFEHVPQVLKPILKLQSFPNLKQFPYNSKNYEKFLEKCFKLHYTIVAQAVPVYFQ